MSESIIGMKRTHDCGALRLSDVGSEVTVMGWAQSSRDLGGVIFVDLRDRGGITQVVFRIDENEEIFRKAEHIRSEYVLAVKGKVVKRDPETVNDKIPTGEIEVLAEELRVVNESEVPPFRVEEDTDVNELTRLKYRFLDLRRPDMQRNLKLRHRVAKTARDYFDKNGFVEIETPMMTKSTPEGARDYLVPSRVHEGKFFALPQSPQLFKQLLMTAGFDKYMQITKCFRDEDLRADRQPEFTQIDAEMSFVDVDDVISVNEGFLAEAFKEAIGIDISLPIPRLTYCEAMDRFGSDKPDLRFGMEINNLSEIVRGCGFKVFADAVDKGGSVRAINAKGCGKTFSRRDIDALTEYVKQFGAKGMAWIVVEENEIKSAITKFLGDDVTGEILKAVNAEPGDLICFSADKNDIVFETLGHLRLHLAEKTGLLKKDEYKFVWVTEFPLLQYDKSENRYTAIHHPFTSPMDEDMDLLDKDPSQVRSKAYDIVLNGCEIGGGSIRIHDRDVQRKMFSLLGFSEEAANDRFGFLLDAFKYGVPPHGGIAYGLDRLIMLMVGEDSIRDVIAFPKIKDSSCPMTNAPDNVDFKQLSELHLIKQLVNK